MKPLLALLALVSAAEVAAQTNAVRTEVTTNYMTAAPNFRVVDDQLYNVERSSRWYQFEGECMRVTNGVVIRLSNVLGPVGNAGPGQWVCIRNYPTNYLPAIGQKLSGKAMRIGTVNIGTATLELWDYGTPNVVGVLVTNRVEIGVKTGNKSGNSFRDTPDSSTNSVKPHP